jgi:hypothetical protein
VNKGKSTFVLRRKRKKPLVSPRRREPGPGRAVTRRACIAPRSAPPKLPPASKYRKKTQERGRCFYLFGCWKPIGRHSKWSGAAPIYWSSFLQPPLARRVRLPSNTQPCVVTIAPMLSFSFDCTASMFTGSAPHLSIKNICFLSNGVAHSPVLRVTSSLTGGEPGGDSGDKGAVAPRPDVSPWAMAHRGNGAISVWHRPPRELFASTSHLPAASLVSKILHSNVAFSHARTSCRCPPTPASAVALSQITTLHECPTNRRTHFATPTKSAELSLASRLPFVAAGVASRSGKPN